MSAKYQHLLDSWNVPRETLDKINTYIDVLYEWQVRINLISSPKSISKDAFHDMVWQRHIIDSLQLLPYLKEKPIVDIGSGAGFPGLLLAMLIKHPVYLVESDKRKCEFLKEAARQTKTQVIVKTQRVESIDAGDLPDSITITSRACASILKLLDLTNKLHSKCDLLLLKGEKAQAELDEAKAVWQLECELFPSVTSEASSIIHIQGVRPHG